MSDWQTESGLFTDYEGVVIDAWFQQGQSGNQEMHWKLTTDSPDVPEHEERWGCGKDWVSPDGGKTVVKSKGRGLFNKNSGFGKVIDKIVEVLGSVEETEKMLGGSPREAGNFIGTKWLFEEQTDKFTDRQTNEEREYSYNLPVKFLGKGSVSGSTGNSTSTSGNTPSQPATSETSTGSSLEALPEKDQVLLKMYANQLDFDSWVDKLLEAVGTADLLNTDQGNTILGTSDTIYQQLRAAG